MDEATLENSIKTYRQQLDQVNQLRASESDGASGQNDQLLQLKKDLEEVIQLTEESLLSLKKSRLMSYVESNDADAQPNKNGVNSVPGSSDTLTMDEEYEAFKLVLSGDLKNDPEPSLRQNTQETLEDIDVGSEDDPDPSPKPEEETLDGIDVGSDDDNNEDEDADDGVDVELQEKLVGTKCSLMHSQEWGATERHNAIILGLEPKSKQDNEIRVSVLYCNPTHQSMRPCPFFLDGGCRYSKEKCRLSHGDIVNLSELSEFQEPNFSLLEVGSKCLAKYKLTHLWYPASIEAVDRDHHKYTVKYQSNWGSADLGPEDVLPRESHYNVSSSDEDDDSPAVDSDLPSTSKGPSDPAEEETEVPVVAWRMLPGVSLGSWEEHTRGIGSKLMAQMGYEYGKGLGKYSQGRTEIVEAVIMPPGRSLDKCMELRQKKQCQIVGEKKTKRKGKHHRTKGTIRKVKKKKDVFAFINDELKGRKAKISDLLKQNFELVKTDKKSLGSKSAPSSGRKINIQLVKTQEEITNTKKDIVRLKQSMGRNERDKKTRQQIEYKIQQKQKYLDSLSASEKKLERQQKSRNHHRKLTIF